MKTVSGYTAIESLGEPDDLFISEKPAPMHRPHLHWVGFEGLNADDIAQDINCWLLDHKGWFSGQVHYASCPYNGMHLVSAIVEFKIEPDWRS